MNIDLTRAGMLMLLVIIVALLVWGLLRRDKLIDSRIDLDDLLIGEDGKLSKASAVMMGAFAVTTWGMAYMWINKTMTEGFFLAYLSAWVAPTVTVLITRRPIPPGQESKP